MQLLSRLRQRMKSASGLAAILIASVETLHPLAQEPQSVRAFQPDLAKDPE